MQAIRPVILSSCIAVLLGSISPSLAMGDKPKADGGPALTLPQENDPWFQAAADKLHQIQDERPSDARAKNVILFVGDGMSIATVTAARILQGQQMGEKGESSALIFETFPRVALSKTYTTDYQTPDSAGTATAMVSGVKTKSMIISLDDTVETSKCGTGAPVMTMMELAELAGLATGVVTTTRLTHATPATNYAHSANRNWESAIPDAKTPETQILKSINPAAAAPLPTDCADIASQLIDFSYGDGPEVAMGGGRRMFLPDTVNDPENEKISGYRKDGRDLTQEWLASSDVAVYVWNKRQLDALNLKKTGRVLGLFEPSHMKFELDRPGDKAGEPSLAEMTSAAIDILSRNDKGYYLMVEGGRIDHAHHGTNAARALTDTIAFSDAVSAALAKVDLSETLIVVTADHAHTMSISGYSERGNPILGKAKSTGSDKPSLGNDGKPYTTLTYANGPSAKGKDPRADLSDIDTTAPDYRQQSLVPMYSETHSGEDVGIWSIGPGSQWLTGVVEQNYIFHVMEGAAELRQKAGANQSPSK